MLPPSTAQQIRMRYLQRLNFKVSKDQTIVSALWRSRGIGGRLTYSFTRTHSHSLALTRIHSHDCLLAVLWTAGSSTKRGHWTEVIAANSNATPFVAPTSSSFPLPLPPFPFLITCTGVAIAVADAVADAVVVVVNDVEGDMT